MGYIPLMKRFLYLLVIVILTNCASDDQAGTLLVNTKWKVSKTTLEFVDGSSEVHTDDSSGGYYITFTNTKEYRMEFYPYTATLDGRWSYSEENRILELQDEYGSNPNKYRVLEHTRDKLILFNDDTAVNKDGMVKVTTELRPF